MAHLSTFVLLSQPQIASLSLSLPPLGLNSVCLRCRHSASGGIDPWRPGLSSDALIRFSPLSHPYPKTQVVSFGLRQAHPDSTNLLLPTFSCLKRPLSPLAPGHEPGVFPLPGVARLLRGPAPSGNEPAQLLRRWHHLPGSVPAGTSAAGAGLRSRAISMKASSNRSMTVTAGTWTWG